MGCCPQSLSVSLLQASHCTHWKLLLKADSGQQLPVLPLAEVVVSLTLANIVSDNYSSVTRNTLNTLYTIHLYTSFSKLK